MQQFARIFRILTLNCRRNSESGGQGINRSFSTCFRNYFRLKLYHLWVEAFSTLWLFGKEILRDKLSFYSFAHSTEEKTKTYPGLNESRKNFYEFEKRAERKRGKSYENENFVVKENSPRLDLLSTWFLSFTFFALTSQLLCLSDALLKKYQTLFISTT